VGFAVDPRRAVLGRVVIVAEAKQGRHHAAPVVVVIVIAGIGVCASALSQFV
jgi:hypothetical protein